MDGIEVRLETGRFDPWAELAATGATATAGATTVFVGTMRDFNVAARVESMYLEHYPGMTERQLRHIVAAAAERWKAGRALVVHRVGLIRPGEAIVLVAVWTAHRAEAFSACREILEKLKHEAPFWKKETLSDGRKRWVRSNTPAEARPSPGRDVGA